MDPITAFIVNLVIGVILSVGSTLAQQAFAGDKKEQARGYRGTAQTGGTVPRSFLVGTIGLPGKLEYRNTWGTAGKTENEYLVDVLSFGDLSITGITGKVWVVGELSTMTLASTAITQGRPVVERAIDGVDNLWWIFRTGLETTANTYLTGKFGADPDRPWETDMIGRGVPQLILTARINEAVWSGWPSYMAEMQGIELYDPRLDTTAGGSGSQRWVTPSTWAFSDNNAVIIYNILRGIHDNTLTVTTLGPHFWGGHARAAQLPYATWAAAMNACDTLIDLVAPATSEKQFRAGREIFLNERPADVIRELLIGANARFASAAGVYYILVGVPAVADGTFTDADLIVSEGMSLQEVPPLDDVINGATATYLEPSQAWENKETAPYIRSDLVTADDNRQQLEGLALDTTFSGTQAQRILKAVIEESRRFRRYVVVLPPLYGQYRPLHVLAWTSTHEGYVGKQFLITSRAEAPNGNVVLGLHEIDPADHDWVPGTDEQPLTFAPMTPIRPAPQPMTGWSVAPYIHTDADSNARRPGIEVFYGAGFADIDNIQVQVRKNITNQVIFDSDQIKYDKADASPSQVIIGDFLLPAQPYEVRGILIPKSGRQATWSAWLDVTTPAIYLDNRDFTETYNSAITVARQTAESVNADFDAFINEFNALPVSEWVKKSQLLTDLATTLGKAETRASQLILVATGPTSALFGRATRLEGRLNNLAGRTYENYVASLNTTIGRLTTLKGLVDAEVISTNIIEARANGASASGAFQMKVQAGSSGGYTRLSAFGRTTDPSYAPRAVGWYAEIPSNPALPTKFVIIADNTYLFDSTGKIVALFKRDSTGKTKLNGAYIPKLTVDQLDVNSLATFFSDVVVQGNVIVRGNVTAANIGAGELTGSKATNISPVTQKIGPTTGNRVLIASIEAEPNGGQIDIVARCFAFSDSNIARRTWFAILVGTRIVQSSEYIAGSVNMSTPPANVLLVTTDKTNIGTSKITYNFYAYAYNPEPTATADEKTGTAGDVKIDHHYMNVVWRDR